MELLTMKPAMQGVVVLLLYTIHLLWCTKFQWQLPRQLIPNSVGAFSSIGADSLIALSMAAAVLGIRKRAKLPLLPPLLDPAEVPWQVPKNIRVNISVTFCLLVGAYIGSGFVAAVLESVMLVLAGLGLPLTIASHRALQVLLGHLLWVYAGVKILGTRLRPFFPPEGKWIKCKWKSNWVWWVTGGYFLSSYLFNIADLVNQFVLTADVLNKESVVTKLIRPEGQDVVALALGSIGPCITGPVWEEVLYRGFMLPALATFLPMPVAVVASGLLFAVHHMNLGGMIPLSVLGIVWAVVYLQSKNLLVTVLIHAMWNSRVFLSPYLE